MKNHFRIIIVFLLLSFISKISQAQVTAQWRGLNRDGKYNETKLLKSWPVNGPKLLWFNESIGAGYAAVAVTQDKVFVNGEVDSISHLFAFDLQGKLLWKAAYGKEFFGNGYSENFPGARSTPTVVNDLVYVCSGNGRIACFETATGKEKWSLSMEKDLGGIQNMFGYSESMLIDGNYLYCTPGGKQSNVVCLDRLTGKTIWTSKALSDQVAFCSPILIKLSSITIFVTMTNNFIMGIDTKNGELLWSQPIDSVKYEGEHCNTPIYVDGHIYYTTNEENGNGTIKLKLADDGKSISTVWQNKKYGNAFGGFVIDNNKLYLTLEKKKLIALDINNGNITDTLTNTKGGIIIADNMIYCYADNGEMRLINYKEGKLKLVSKFKIDKGTKEPFAHPVIDRGVLYVRHGKALMAFDLKE